MDLLYQILGIVALIVAIISFQVKKDSLFLVFQLVSSILWAVDFSLVGGWAATLINIVCVLRAFLFYIQKTNKQGYIYSVIISIMLIACMFLEIYVFNEVVWISILCTTSTVGQTFIFSIKREKLTRYYQIFVQSPAFIANGIVYGSIGSLTSDSLNIISSIVALIRWKIKEKKELNTNNIEK